MPSKTLKRCMDTKSAKGCGLTLPLDDFKVIRVNERTGNILRKRMCRKCENKSNRVGEKPKEKLKLKERLEKDAELYNQFNRLMGAR